MPVNPNSSSKVPHKSSIFLSNSINFPIYKVGTGHFQVLKISKIKALEVMTKSSSS